jgi:N-glycosidase YbiA
MISSFRDEYFFLSNFYPVEIKLDGIVYPNAETAFQAQKTLDVEERRKFSMLKNPVQAKRLGRKVKLRDDWEEVKLDIMTEVVSQKFLQHPHLIEMLLQTGDEELVEGNKWDVCKGKGENHLGKILMKIRDVYKSI